MLSSNTEFSNSFIDKRSRIVNNESEKLNFVVTFEKISHKSTDKKGVVTPPKPIGTEQFLVEACDEVSARKYAERFQNIALGWSTSITHILDLRLAQSDDLVQLGYNHLSSMKSIYPNR